MRNLITATVIASALMACGRQSQSNSGTLSDASVAAPAAAAAQAFTWKVSYDGASTSGPVSLAPGGTATIAVDNMPADQKGALSLQLLDATGAVKYSGTVSALTVAGGSQVRRVILVAGPGSASAPAPAASGAQYCGNNNIANNFDNSNNNSNFNNDNSLNASNFNNNNDFNNNSDFNNGSIFNNGGLGRFDTGTDTASTTATTPTTTTSSGAVGQVAPKSAANLQLMLVAPN